MSAQHPWAARAALPRMLAILLAFLGVFLGALLGVLASVVVAPPARAADDDPERTPLTVRLTSLSPAIPMRGMIVLRGLVTNSSDEVWQDINVHPFVSTFPMTTRAELVEAVELPETSDVGDRITTPGQFASIGDLDPGQSRSFLIRLPREDLGVSGAAGVYWIGVHALGLSAEGRDGTADGRARTFIPLVAGSGLRAQVAVVVPLREPVRRAVDGRILGGDEWAETLGEDGRLGRILTLTETAGQAAFTWLVDPAVLDAAGDIAAGNPRLSYGEARPDEEEPPPSPTASGTSFSVSGLGKASASTWLTRFTGAARGRAVLGLPYADPDVAALLRIRPSLLDRAQDLAEDSFARYGISATDTFAPPSGWISPEVQESRDAALVIGSDGGTDVDGYTYTLPSGAGLVLGDERAATGGPLPTIPTAALAMRQRILADAALHALSGRTDPLPVVLPLDWDPGARTAAASFFAGLQRPWLTLVPLGLPLSTPAPVVTDLPYPPSERAREIGSAEVSAAGALINTGALLAEVLDTDNDVLNRVVGSALSATSYAARGDESLATLVRGRAGALANQLDGVKVQGTEFNTLSSGEGRLTVTVVNGLQQPVKLGLRVDADSGLEVTPPDAPVEVGPDQRTTLRLQTRAGNIGVYDVTLTPVTDQGRAFGTPLEMTVRTSQVGRFIWIVLAVAGGVFVVMIIRRIVQRIRSHRWKPERA